MLQNIVGERVEFNMPFNTTDLPDIQFQLAGCFCLSGSGSGQNVEWNRILKLDNLPT